MRKALEGQKAIAHYLAEGPDTPLAFADFE